MPPAAPAPAAADTTGSAALGVGFVLISLVSWSVAPALIHEFRGDVDAWTSNAVRYGLSAVIWLPFLVWRLTRRAQPDPAHAAGSHAAQPETARPGGARPLPLAIWRDALLPSAVNAAAQVPFAWAFYIVQPGLVAFGLRTQIVAATLGAALLFPAERALIRRPLFVIGAAMVVAGVVAVGAIGMTRDGAPPAGSPALSTTADQTEPAATAAPSTSHAAEAVADPGLPVWLGVACAMLAGVGYAGYALAVRRNMRRYGAMDAFAVISQYTAVAMVVLVVVFGDRSGLAAFDLAAADPARFGLLVLSGVIGIAFGHVIFYAAMSRLGVALSTGVVQLQPFTVAAISVPWFGESLTPLQWMLGTAAVGGALTMLSVQADFSAAARRLRRLRLRSRHDPNR